MQHKLKPRANYRIERSTTVEVSETDGHLWAVSYSDLLMVLLSFFILFFSLDEKKTNEVINGLLPVAEILGPGTGVHSSGGAGGFMKVAGSDEYPAKVQTLDKLNHVSQSSIKGTSDFKPPLNLRGQILGLNGFEIEKGTPASAITLVFPTNIYSAGQSKLPSDQKLKLGEILSRLAPYIPQLRFEFIGHADSTPVSHSKNRFLKDNIDLSAYRAAEALRYALSVSSLTVDQTTAKGSGAGDVGNRTLSIKISLKENI